MGIFWAHHGYVRSIADVRDVAHQSPRSHDSEPYRAPRTEGGASAHRPKQGTFFLSPRKREGNEISHIIGAHPQGWLEGAMARGERSHYMTIVEDHGVYASTCGYCKSTKATFKSHGMSAHACSVEDYQHLIDRGWRRSGNWMYQPVLDDTCCPPYTVRLDVNEFTPTKSQKKVERRFTAYLEGRIDERGAPISREGDAKATHDAGAPTRPGGPTEDDAVAAMIERAVTRAVAKCVTNGSLSPGVAAVASTGEIPVKVRRAKAPSATAMGATHSCSVAVAIASVAGKRAGNGAGGLNCGFADAEADKTARALVCAMEDDETFVGVKIWCTKCGAGGGHVNFAASTTDGDERSMGQKKQSFGIDAMDVNGASNDSPRARSKSVTPKAPSEVRKDFTVTTVPSAFDEEEYQLWRRYQTKVHGDDPNDNNKLGYTRFLVDTPLKRVNGGEVNGALVPEDGDDGNEGWVDGWALSSQLKRGEYDCAPAGPKKWVAAPPSGFGSFHQQYRIDGKLVAVGVVDVLPFCLSSKYFFWDPDYAALSLGKLGTLREIEWVREANRHCPTLRYYYMGYYIHDCPKMRYKGEYKPSYLRCGATGKWCALDQVRESVLDRGTGFAPFAAAVERPPLNPASAVERDDKDAVGCNLGLIRGNRLGEAIPASSFLEAAPLPPAIKSRLREKVGRWARAVGNVKESMIYLLSLDRLTSEAGDDDDDNDDDEEDFEGTEDDELDDAARVDIAARV